MIQNDLPKDPVERVLFLRNVIQAASLLHGWLA